MSDDDELRYRFVSALHDLKLYEDAARRIVGQAGWFALRSPEGSFSSLTTLNTRERFGWAERSQPVNGALWEQSLLQRTN